MNDKVWHHPTTRPEDTFTCRFTIHKSFSTQSKGSLELIKGLISLDLMQYHQGDILEAFSEPSQDSDLGLLEFPWGGISIDATTNVPKAIVTRAPAPRPQELPTKNEEPMDLGSLVKDLATTYIEARYGDQRPVMGRGPIYAQPVSATSLPAIIGGGLSRLPSLGGITGGILGGGLGDFLSGGTPLMGGGENFGGSMGGCNNPSDIVFKWSPQAQDYVPQKRRKRRRKQLVTQSDIKGLAALKGVVGTGKIMETWIATHA